MSRGREAATLEDEMLEAELTRDVAQHRADCARWALDDANTELDDAVLSYDRAYDRYHAATLEDDR